jgi:LL-diaminopimelate aminotransferase
MDIQKLFADRIGGEQFGLSNEVYKFGKIKAAKAEARRSNPGVELLDFGVGEPDRMAPEAIRAALKTAVDKPENRGYADNGSDEFKQAAAKYMQDFFGVDLDWTCEVNHCVGCKPALAMLPLCFVNPGDVVFKTVPGYPVLGTYSRYLGADVHNLTLSSANSFYPDLDAIDPELAARAKLFYINYPNNPTGQAATPDFFDRMIEFARRHNILIVQDAAYATLNYAQERLSILSRPGGKDVAVELHSMSKSYNMTGWRLGFVAGSSKAIAAFAEIKDNTDSGQFKAIQEAACAGIADVQLSEDIREHYRVRLEKLVAALRAVGFDAQMPGGTFYIYLPAPKAAGETSFANAEEASQYLIKKHCISTVPWDDAGAFLRFSATFESAGDEDDERVIDEVRRRLAAADLKF